MSTIKKWVDHNQGLVTSVVLCVVLAISVLMFGCRITTENPFEPGTQVSRQELEIEAQAYAQKIELAYQDLSKKEEIVRLITEAGLAYASGGGVNPLGVATAMMGVLGAGAVVDNRRKDSVIKSKSNALDQIVKSVPEDTTKEEHVA